MIIITGASKGIGQSLFRRFKMEGVDIFGTYNSTHDEVSSNKELYYKVDISDYKQVKIWVETIKPSLNKIILINCAGISYNSYAHKSNIEQWKSVIDVNLTGTFNVIHCFLPLMREQHYGRIINLSSVVAKLPTPGVSAYAASKAGLIGLTKSLAIENAALGITVNAINLGYSDLGMGINNVPEFYQKKMKQLIPAGRFCRPEEIFNTINYLISTEYINGADVDLNGGIL
jgi:NAD(P)-dependent dehydrogenase (short-subunit alcohol dehydrogenase family)